MRNFLFGLTIITIISCQGQKNGAENKNPESFKRVPLSKDLQEKQNSGIDFVSAPDQKWSMEVDFDGNVKIGIGKKDTMVIDANKLKYKNGSANYTQDELSIVVKPKESSSQFSHEVVVTKGKKTYSGEGNFINKSLELIGEWGIPQPDSIKSRPVSIHFQDALKVIGFDGCNQFFGHYSADQENIYFETISATRKVCMDMPTTPIPNQMGAQIPFTIKNNKLTLLKSDSSTVTLHRVIL